MIVYIVMLLISIVFLKLEEKQEKKKLKILMLILAVVPFFLVSILRYDLGTDYLKRYVHDFNEMAQGRNIENLEIGFKLLIQFCLIFTTNPNILFVITSTIILGLIMYTIFTKSKNYILSILIFFLCGFFFNSLNLVRQYIAISLILFGYRFLLKEKKYYFAYILCTFIAMTMHSTSMIAIILVFLNKKEIMNFKWLIPISFLILIINENLFELIKPIIQNTRFNVYLTGNMAKGEISILYILENFLVYIFMYYIYIKNKKVNQNGKEETLLLNVQGLSLLTTVCGACHMQFMRIALYFFIFQIISIPLFIYKIPVDEVKKDIEKIFKKIKISSEKIKLEKIMPKFKEIISVIFIICLLCVFWHTNIKNNDNEVVPYKTIINKEISIGEK